MATQIPLMNDGNIVGDTTQIRTKRDNVISDNSRPGDTSFVLHRSLHQGPLHVVSAKGHYLHLSNGQKIFDATGGAAVACLGHGDER